MKIIVLGAAGMLGHVAGIFLKEKYGARVVLSARAKSGAALIDQGLSVIDLTDTKSVHAMIAQHRPCIVVNCAAVNDAGKGFEELDKINTRLPLAIASLLDEKKDGSRLIHISTDGVFRGDRGRYSEEDNPDADDLYGKSKRGGEVTRLPHLTIRTSIIGPDPFKSRGLMNWFMSQERDAKGFTKVFWSGVTTLELAKFIDFAINENISGLYHLCSQRISKHDLLTIIKDVFAKGVVIRRDEAVVSDRSLISKRTDISYKILGLRQMVDQLKAWMTEHSDVYK
jgi:dTDP-4-dehydrorhamnose reductase